MGSALPTASFTAHLGSNLLGSTHPQAPLWGLEVDLHLTISMWVPQHHTGNVSIQERFQKAELAQPSASHFSPIVAYSTRVLSLPPSFTSPPLLQQHLLCVWMLQRVRLALPGRQVDLPSFPTSPSSPETGLGKFRQSRSMILREKDSWGAQGSTLTCWPVSPSQPQAELCVPPVQAPPPPPVSGKGQMSLRKWRRGSCQSIALTWCPN